MSQRSCRPQHQRRREVLPSSFTVSGGGFDCEASPGVPITLSNSQVGVSYELYAVSTHGEYPLYQVLQGTGSGLSWQKKGAGEYAVYATNSTTGCSKRMDGTANITLTTIQPDVNFLNAWAFQYKYDDQRRMIAKKVPGADWVYMVYDDRDRLVMTQDGNQRAGSTKYWTFTKYDAFNRPVLTGIYTSANTLTQMQDAVNSYYANLTGKAWYETFTGSGSIHGYDNKSFPQETDPNNYLTVTYYDNYNFRSSWAGSYTYVNDGLSLTINSIPYNQRANEETRTKGQVTGTKVKILDGGVRGGYAWLKTVNYYDDKYRVIQTISDNTKGGEDRTSNLYDFTGKVLKTKTTHITRDVTWKDMTGIDKAGTKLYRNNSSSGWGTAGGVSVQTLGAGQNGYIEITATEINTARAFGLSDANTNNNYTSIDYAFVLQNDNKLRVYENGTQRWSQDVGYKPGDILRIERNGTTVTYKKNGTTVYTSAVASSTLLMADIAISNNNGTLLDVRASFATVTNTTTRTFEYDHAGRLKEIWHQVDTEPPVLLVSNDYNELGQLVDKKLHSTNGTNFAQSVDYRYNIRGWLTKINESDVSINESGDPLDYFGMQLGYNDDIGTGNAANAQYNGNISGVKWSSNLGLGTIKERSYNYTYDPMNRITGAAFKQKATSWQTPTGNSFSEGGYSYDLNGNIMGFTRKGTDGSDMDILTYNYGEGTARSNKLLYVTDNGDDDKGFVDGYTSGNDYNYDPNGNMTFDKNKGINGTSTSYIIYNYLNLPERVQKTATQWINYVYDATGRKLHQYVTDGSTKKSTDYAGEYFYENDELKFINHEEGRIIPDASGSEYQYHLKDHLGNVRLTFTTETTTETFTAGFETANQGEEATEFENYPSGGQINTQAVNARTGTNSQLLNGGYSGQVGLAKSFSVMPGDVVSIQAYAKYNTPSGTSTNYTNFVSALLAAFNLSAPAVGETGTAAAGVNTFGNWELGATGHQSEDDPMKIFVTIFLFDRNYNFIDAAYSASTGSGALMSASYTVKEPGYAYLYISNEHPYQMDAYFDDVSISYTPSPVVQMDDYYPFGLAFNSYSRENSTPNMYQYNGKEMQDELSLGWLDYGARYYDAAIAHWLSVDPSAESYPGWSPYVYSFNNPIRFTDPDGQDPEDVVRAASGYIGTNYEWGGKNPTGRLVGAKGRLTPNGGVIGYHTAASLELKRTWGTKQYSSTKADIYHTFGVQRGSSFGIDCSGLAAKAFNADPDKLMGDLAAGTANDQMQSFAAAQADGTGTLHNDLNLVGMGDLVFNTNSEGKATHVMVATGEVKTDKNGNVKKFQVVEATQSGDKVRTNWKKVSSSQQVGHTFRRTDAQNAGPVRDDKDKIRLSGFVDKYQNANN